MVHENYRRRGIGKRIWNRAFGRLEGLNVGLEARKDMLQYYRERYGFGHDYKVAVYQCFGGLKLQSSMPSIHGLSFETIFEGRLIEKQSSNGVKERTSTLAVHGTFLTCAMRQNVGMGKVGSNLKGDGIACRNCQNITACIAEGASTLANNPSVKSFSGDIDMFSAKSYYKGDALVINKSVVSPSEDACKKSDNNYFDSITKLDTVNLLKYKCAFSSSSRFSALSHLCKDTFGAERMSKIENETVIFSNNDASSESIISSTDQEDFPNCKTVDVKMNEDLCVEPQYVESYIETNNNASVDAYAVQKYKPIRFSIDELLNKVVDYDGRWRNRECSFIVRQSFSWRSCRTKIAIASDETVVGYGCIRKCISDRWILSPLYADTLEIAEHLLRELLQDFDFSEASEGILLYFPDKNARWKDLLKRYGFQDTGWDAFYGFTEEGIGYDTDRIYSFRSIEG